MKFNLGSLLDREDFSPQKKKLLAIGSIAFILLLFASFLISLSEDDESKDKIVPPIGAQIQQPFEQGNLNQDLNNNNNLAQSTLDLPSSKRYDFDLNNEGEGLESLLNDEDDTKQNTKEPEIGLNNNPFSSMQGQGTEALGPAQIPTEDEEQNLGPAPIPQEETTVAQKPQTETPPSVKANLYCDSFASSAAAESQKAMLAFQGLSATVVKAKDGTFQLRIGPYASADLARQKFGDLANKGLVSRCSLISE